MAKNKGKNSNYQTETRRATELLARHQQQKEEQRRKKLPHRLSKNEKKKLKFKTTQVICIVLVVLLVLTSGATAVVSILFSEKQMTAADYLYPPLFLYDGTYYMVTSEQLSEKPEGDSTEELTAVTTGNQNTFPIVDGSCNFGGNTVPFLLVDGVMYCCTEEGIYLKCSVFDTGTSNESSEESSSSESSASENTKNASEPDTDTSTDNQ